MAKHRTPDVPPNGRLIAVALAASGGIGLLANHYLAQSQHVVRLLILCLGPLTFFLGVGGIIEPRIMWSVGKHGKHLPMKYKVMGVILAAMGVVVTIALVFIVYPLGPPGVVPRR